MTFLRIGLMVNDIESEYTLPILEGVTKYCQEENIECYVFLTRTKTLGESHSKFYSSNYFIITKLFNEHNLDGLLTVTPTQCIFISKEDFQDFLKSLKPLKSVSIGLKLADVPSVTVKNREAVHKLVTHLITKHSCKRFLLLTSDFPPPDVTEREEGFFSALKDAELDFDEKHLIRSDYSYGSFEKKLSAYKTMEDIDFDAIVCTNDNISLEAIEYFARLGIKIPKDIKLVGFDDYDPVHSALSTLTTINQHLFEQGYEGARTLKEYITKNRKKDCFIKASVKYRKSCGCVFGSASRKTAAKTLQQTENEKEMSNNEVKFLILREKLLPLQYFLQDLQATSSLEDFKKEILSHLLELNITNFAIVLFEKPVYNIKGKEIDSPDSAFVFLSFDSNNDKLDGGFDDFFNPLETIIPDGYISRSANKLVISLFNSNIIYGYFILEPRNTDFLLYPTVSSILSNALASNITFISKVREANSLKQENMILTDKNTSLEEISYTDEMTEVLNRRGLFAFGQDFIDKAVEAGKTGLVIFCDMDGLKKINDTFGHEKGDLAIKAECEILKKSFRLASLIARFGGDEFVIIINSMTYHDFINVKQQIIELSEDWNKESKEGFNLSISLGATKFHQKNHNLEDLLATADKKLYDEKKQHRTLLKF